MEQYTVEQFLEDVRNEAKALRENADEAELKKLDIDKLEADNSACCIYGQMTGDCYSERAEELIINCCKQAFVNNTTLYEARDLESVLGNALGAYFSRQMRRRKIFFSAIETYILTEGAKNASLIAYLRGETDTLDL